MSEAASNETTSALRKAPLVGRRRIYTCETHIGADNIESVMSKALCKHLENRNQECFLLRYYRGIQPILGREKKSRSDVCNNVVENHAQECVQFKVGYQLAEPLQYVPRSGEDDVPDGHIESENKLVNQVRLLNDMFHACGKASLDRDLFEWMCVCGVGYRIVRAVPESERTSGEPPFMIYTADPRSTFVIRSAEYHHRVMAGVWIGEDEDTGTRYYTVYTDTEVLTCEVPSKGVPSAWSSFPNPNGVIIFEYELNSSRMGVFEPAIPLLDAINTVVSNRIDGVEQNIDAITVFDNVNIDADTYDAMLEKKAIKTRSVDGCNGKVYNLTYENDQTQTQVTKQDLYDSFANIVGMPNMTNKTGSSSDTGTAVLLRDGWTLAESHAKSYELKWKDAERRMLSFVLDICRVQKAGLDISVSDVDMNFNRRNYENTLVKAQTLTTMLSEDRIDPELAFEVCGLFTDPTSAYLQSAAHYEQVSEKQAQQTQQELNDHNSAVQKVSQANKVAEETGVHPAG